MIIGLSGKAGVGKGAIANEFVKNGFKELYFAYYIKKILAKLLDIDIDYFHDPILKENIIPGYNITPRELMINFGTYFCRKYLGDNFWISKLDKYIHKYNDVVISDVRFNNEAEYILSKKGIVVNLYRDVKSRTVFNNNITERGIDNKYITISHELIGTPVESYNTLVKKIYL